MNAHIIDAPMRVRVKQPDKNLFLLAVPGTELSGEPYFAMLLGYQVRKSWMDALYDGLSYYDGLIIEMQAFATEAHMNCLKAARNYIANLIWLADTEQMEVELCHSPDPKLFAEG